MNAEPVTPLAVLALVMTGADATPFPEREAKVDEPPLSKRIFALFTPNDWGVNCTVAVQVADGLTIPVQVVDIT